MPNFGEKKKFLVTRPVHWKHNYFYGQPKSRKTTHRTVHLNKTKLKIDTLKLDCA